MSQQDIHGNGWGVTWVTVLTSFPRTDLTTQGEKLEVNMEVMTWLEANIQWVFPVALTLVISVILIPVFNYFTKKYAEAKEKDDNDSYWNQ